MVLRYSSSAVWSDNLLANAAREDAAHARELGIARSPS